MRVNGAGWIARAAGLGTTGQARGSGAPLLLVTFARVDEPEQPALEALAAVRHFADLTELDLMLLLGRARPIPGSASPDELFSDTRRK